MRRFILLTLLLLFAGMAGLYAQKTVTGVVTSEDDGKPMPGVTILIKGTQNGTVSDLSGKYKINVPGESAVLVFSFVGMKTQEITVGTQTEIKVVMQTTAIELEGAVITALGISREKKSLGYATQQIGGEDVSTVRTDNFINTMSGKVSGVQIKTNNNIGGSTNIVIRGSSSLTGNNQALFVIDGVPVSNANTNSANTLRGRTGYDYGNAAADINPDDIESINVLKGAAATALYGSRAANGVIIITTKKGKQTQGKSAIGVTLNLSGNMGVVDKSTFANYQNQYGGGYGPYYSVGDYPGLYEYDFDGDGIDDLVVPTTEDASFGAKFDPNLMVYQWNSFDPESPLYMKKTPWVAAENGPVSFFNNSYTLKNSVAIDGANELGNFRLSYSKLDQSGIMPNSSIKRNNLSFNGSYNFTDKLTATADINYVKTNGKGRNSTGYSDNIVSSFRQWWQTNVDVQELWDMYDATGRNVTWNWHSEDLLVPEYWDNPYWTRYENYETDYRDRLFGNIALNYKLNKNFSFLARATTDYSSEVQEERRAVGSIAAEFGISRLDEKSGYSRYNRIAQESNYDFMVNYKGQINKDINISALLGTNYRKNFVNSIFASTNGGLVVPGLYSLSNSVSSVLAPVEGQQMMAVLGIFGSASFGYKNFLYIDGTLRRDKSSTLPEGNNVYMYPSVTTSFIFSELLKLDWMQFGKFRINYAMVGNDAPFASIYDTYAKPSPFGDVTLFSVPNTKNNSDLRPEKTKNIETGLEFLMFKNRLGFDFAVYKKNTVDQILPVSVSTATGYSTKYVNSGEIENKGIELSIFGTPLKTKNFKWNVALNWSKNVNKVISLYDGVDNLVLGSFQGGVTINATVGEAYGTIQGTDFVYDGNGNKVINSTGYRNGYYKISSTSDIVIGNINPDWNAGLTNTFTYNNWSFSFLLDWQKGGSVFSLDQWYGQATGLYASTVFENSLDNPIRDPLVYNTDGSIASTSGGILLEGVKEDGTVNDQWIPGDRYTAFGYARYPNSAYVYDASYLKLRELTLTYKLSAKILEKTFIRGAAISFVGNNLYILYKNLPDADPEAGVSSGNLQGWQSGVLPTTRNFGLNVNLQF